MTNEELETQNRRCRKYEELTKLIAEAEHIDMDSAAYMTLSFSDSGGLTVGAVKTWLDDEAISSIREAARAGVQRRIAMLKQERDAL